jgi:gliding motility-associated-like protein
LCTQEEVTLTPQLARNVPTTYLWSTGETSAFITVTGPGEYIVEAIQGNCVLIDSLEVKGSISGGALYVPNTFTPGPDYLNDIFYAEGEAILEFHMQIFDRWGERIFESYKQSEGWDGTYKGKPVPLDTYVWIIDYASDCNGETTMRKSGTVTALR